MICLNCGNELPDDSTLCNNCVHPVKTASNLLPKPTPCPECGGERVEAELEVYRSFRLRRPGLKYYFGNNPNVVSEIRVFVCTYCGYTAFFAQDPLNLVVKRPDGPIKE